MTKKQSISTHGPDYNFTWYEDNDDRGHEGALIYCETERSGLVFDSDQLEALIEFINAVKVARGT